MAVLTDRPMPRFQRFDGSRCENFSKAHEFLLQAIEILQGNHKLALGATGAQRGQLRYPGGGSFKSQNRLMQFQRHDAEKCPDINENGRFKTSAQRLFYQDNLPMTCSIFWRRISAVNGLPASLIITTRSSEAVFVPAISSNSQR